MSDRAAWLGQVADEFMLTGVLPLMPFPAQPELVSLSATAYPAPESADWKAREIRFAAGFRNGTVIVTARTLPNPAW